ncbi:pyrroloquinoline quinone-dependent dehydrogenase, partial [Candidatus Sumerlaeota bacterium]|nr:pyrroloquinoline quinone-dependent dehydrogenase [Candidatus Sumerlaeota bacterium]
MFNACASVTRKAPGTEDVEWRVYGSDAANRKYSPLDQIHGGNFSELRIAWRWDSVDVPILEASDTLRATSLELTPLMAGGRLYASTSLSQAAAIDPATGRTIWTFDPKSYETGRPPNWGFVHRGVTYWAGEGEERIYLGTGDARLIALNARDGKPISSFGTGGSVDLKRGIPRLGSSTQYGLSSPPAICRGVIIVGSSITDGPRIQAMPPGDVRGYDVRTGRLLWTFHTIPQAGEPGNETWDEDAWPIAGNTNSWTLMSSDEELGYVYVPIGTPTNDWFGGHRLGDNLYAESLVCLEAETGRRVWHFQMVHHGLWDYDLPAAPILCDITVGGKSIKAVAQISKQGFCYVLDRTTGEPVWPIVERPVPQTMIAGEATSPTQPFPTKPPPFERQGVTVDDLIDFTPELRAEAVEIIAQLDHGPLFTPPSLRGNIQLPGSSGGANWGGAAFDPESAALYIPSITSPITVKLAEPDPNRSDFRYIGSRQALAGPQDLPLLKPPYGRITALDLNTGERLWMVPNGKGTPKIRDHPLLKDLDLPPLGQVGRAGPLLTKSLLIVGEGSALTNSAGRDGGGPALRAYDKATGRGLG